MPNILIVDDSTLARKFVKQCVEIALTNCEATFVEASHGQHALEIISTQPVQVVISDLNMPVCNGEELLHSIKNNDLYKHIHVLIVSSVYNEEFERRLKEGGACAVLGKPVSPQQIAIALKPLCCEHGSK